MSVLVSVILATHNRANMLSTAVNSILLQTYKNLEIIVVVDGCNDNTMKVLEKYNDDNRFKIIFSESNVGGAQARNLGINKSRGDFLVFLDDDDSWLPEKVSKQLKAFQEHDDVCIVGCNYYNFKDGGYLYYELNKNSYRKFLIKPETYHFLPQTSKCHKESYYDCIASELNELDYQGICEKKCIH